MRTALFSPRSRSTPDLGQVRVTRNGRRFFAAGRVINPRLVRSQIFWRHDLGAYHSRLHEHAVMDRRSGRILNADLADYHVPVNAGRAGAGGPDD